MALDSSNGQGALSGEAGEGSSVAPVRARGARRHRLLGAGYLALGGGVLTSALRLVVFAWVWLSRHPLGAEWVLALAALLLVVLALTGFGTFILLFGLAHLRPPSKNLEARVQATGLASIASEEGGGLTLAAPDPRVSCEEDKE